MLVVFFNKKKKEENKDFELLSPANGDMIKVEKVDDPMFAEKMLGDGFAVIASDGEVFAPISGEVVVTHDCKYCLGIRANDRLEVLIHIGIDTVSLDGEGFDCYAKMGDHVEAGQHVIDFDRDFLLEHGFKPYVIVVVMDNDKLEKLDILEEGKSIAGKTVHAIAR